MHITEFAMFSKPWKMSATALGFALGGFFDDILLHQILQWHHLLSLVPGMADLRLQMLWDGYFHALMYVVAAVALAGLWRARDLAGPLAGPLLIGFGLWHIVDSILSHWLLGIHRIRIDSDQVLMWDLIWFAAFGLVPLLIGWRVHGAAVPRSRPSTFLMVLVGAATVLAGGWSLRAPADQPFTTIAFRLDHGPDRVYAALHALDARLVWANPALGVVVVSVLPSRRWEFYRHGALLVSGAGVPAGCFGWSAV
jgi:uncharacterized membrane protein